MPSMPIKKMPFNVFRRSFAAVMAMAVLLQMGMVSVTYAACSSKGTERIAIGEMKCCCKPDVLDFVSLSQKCCEIEKSEAVFFSHKDSKDEVDVMGAVVVSTHFALSADATVAVPLRHAEVHMKVPPRPGQVLILRDCRLNV